MAVFRFANGSTVWEVPNLSKPRHSSVIRPQADQVSVTGWSIGFGYAGRHAQDTRDHAFRIGAKLIF
ncbi:MAG: hypothetical protein K9H25_11780 [Rhodospirillum sp.]|nr:hypothetical protein [Rhodospirillum sp.]MCF8489929.1 hypothetical protein [Rhodospirillum sp.]MCF8502360.1 hypothetical protein [Rhodospirillum sp.]